jgi:CRISPR-associated protein Cmr2
MTIQLQSQTAKSQIQLAIAWCLVYEANSAQNAATLEALRQHFYHNQPCRDDLAAVVTEVKALSDLTYPETIADLQTLIAHHPNLWQNKIGLVYGGATKIKSYVFDLPKLHEIRGASAILDKINLVDLPTFFHAEASDEARFSICHSAQLEYPAYITSVLQWLQDNQYTQLRESLIPELIIYSTGGNILAFCPADVTTDLANAIEKRYTTETLIANSCAVGHAFKPLEILCGLLPDEITDEFRWCNHYQTHANDELVQAYLKIAKNTDSETIVTKFRERKSFNELVSKLAILFNQRRAGNDVVGRSSRRYPPMFETQPYLQRDNTEKRSAIFRAERLPNAPWHSEVSARKRLMGQITKRDGTPKSWYRGLKNRWSTEQPVENWVQRFEKYLKTHSLSNYYKNQAPSKIEEAQTLGEIGNASDPDQFIAYIYADGNNMGGYIQKIRSPEQYRQFSEDVSRITEESVYASLAEHLTVHELEGLNDPDSQHKNGDWIHPFEIITIGGDDVFLVVPADRALQIANSISKNFERELAKHSDYRAGVVASSGTHRYTAAVESTVQSELSTSIGVLITAEDTPILYAEKLTQQLLKSAKEKAKQLKKNNSYCGGTIDFQVLKSVTMISSDISEFRQTGLVKRFSTQQPKATEPSKAREQSKKLHLYATPYTLHEIDGFIRLIQALKDQDFPRSQLYQIRSFLEKGKRTAILNYRYFRVRLKQKPQDLQKTLIELFEDSWCAAKENNGNIAPWMYHADSEPEKAYYETIWRELVDLYEFIPKSSDSVPEAARSALAEVES